MDTPKRKTVFQRARRTTYASIGWEPDDVRVLRPEWDAAQAAAFLAAVEERLAEMTLAAGWEAMAALLAECEPPVHANGDQHGQ